MDPVTAMGASLPWSISALAEMAATVERVAQEAAAVCLRGWRTGVAVERKGDIDLVTAWDRASEDVLREGLTRAFPDIALVAEEAGGTAPVDAPVFFADPLDGTTNFAHGHPFFAVSVGLMVGSEAVLGVVVAPALRTVWRGSLGTPATRDGGPCRVSATARLGDALLATGFPYDVRSNPLHNFAHFAALTKMTRGVRRCGSAALDLCLTADGTFDGYWERHLKPWDMAGGAAIVRAAGGTVTDLRGGPADPRQGELLASNGRVHAELLAALRAVDAGSATRGE
ncbi:MAG: inositol monophosphatase family protein [Polyangiales bacterium]